MKLTQEHEDCTSRRKKLEERALSQPCSIQNNSLHCHRSLPCEVNVWSEDSELRETTVNDDDYEIVTGKEDKSDDICR